MASGALYVCVNYPGHIGLAEHSSYIFLIEGRPASVLINRHVEALEVLDFDNEIVLDPPKGQPLFQLKNPIVTISESNLIVEHWDKPRLFIDTKSQNLRVFQPRPFTELILACEVRDTSAPSEEDFSFHNKVLEGFIRAYRHLTHDVRISMPRDLHRGPAIKKACTIAFDETDMTFSSPERLLRSRVLPLGLKEFPIKEVLDRVPALPKDAGPATEAMLLFLALGNVVPPESEALEKAYEDVAVRRNYKYALLDAFICAEIFVTRYIVSLKQRKGVSKSKIDRFKTEVPFGYVLNVELPCLVEGGLSPTEFELISQVDNVRKLRNDVVHENGEVTEKDALHAVNAVRSLIHFLNSKDSSSDIKKIGGHPS
ncbi:MAG: hypothetical protein V2A74_00400 [bacterium]